jgi:hypothetical protein
MMVMGQGRGFGGAMPPMILGGEVGHRHVAFLPRGSLLRGSVHSPLSSSSRIS